MTYPNLANECRSGFSPTLSPTKDELFDSEKACPGGGHGA